MALCEATTFTKLYTTQSAHQSIPSPHHHPLPAEHSGPYPFLPQTIKLGKGWVREERKHPWERTRPQTYHRLEIGLEEVRLLQSLALRIQRPPLLRLQQRGQARPELFRVDALGELRFNGRGVRGSGHAGGEGARRSGWGECRVILCQVAAGGGAPSEGCSSERTGWGNSGGGRRRNRRVEAGGRWASEMAPL